MSKANAAEAKAEEKTEATARAEPLSAAAVVTALGPDRWRQKEFENPGHCVYVTSDTRLERVLAPSFWANVAGKLRPGNTIEVHWDDFSQFAELYVRSCGRNWASVGPLRHVEIKTLDVPQQRENYRVGYNGTIDKFRIMRLSDNAVIRAGFASELQAQTWLEEYRRKLAA